MDALALLRQQFKECNQRLNETMQGVTSDHAHWKPPGTANPLGATYAHALMTQDRVANVAIKAGAALFSTTWSSKTGLSEPAPTEDIPGWAQWARCVLLGRSDVWSATPLSRASACIESLNGASVVLR